MLPTPYEKSEADSDEIKVTEAKSLVLEWVKITSYKFESLCISVP